MTQGVLVHRSQQPYPSLLLHVTCNADDDDNDDDNDDDDDDDDDDDNDDNDDNDYVNEKGYLLACH